MAETLFFLHADPVTAAALAAPLASRGYAIEIASPSEPHVCDTIADTAPLALVISLDGECDEAREVAAGVLADARVPRPLMLFVGGTAREVQETKESLPFGVFLDQDEVVWSLKRLTATV
ncbi:MAG: hypothetical protein HY876_04900 [Coriobacteriales bacterium]|nr:hypothetical protein [Coriobacteriales bacterium]